MSFNESLYGSESSLQRFVHDVQQKAIFGGRDNPEAVEQYAIMQASHADYLGDLVADVTERATVTGAVVQQLDPERPDYFIKTGGSLPVLDVEKLGLPPVQTNVPYLNIDKAEPPKALALFFHATEQGATDKGRPTPVSRIELVLVGKEGRLSSLYLENPSAAVEGAALEKPTWVRPGSAVISSHEERHELTESVNGRAAILLTEPRPGEGGTTRIIRPVVNPKLEARLAKPERPQKHRVAKAVGAAGTAMLTLLAVPAGQDPHKNQELISGDQVVRPVDDYQYKGVDQAESFFDEPTLDRSRKAFDVFMNNGVTPAEKQAALQAQMEADGYKPNWVRPQAIEAIQQAQNSRDLQASFKEALAGLPVSFTICSNQQLIDNIKSGYTLTTTHDFEASKQWALAAVDMFNLFDKQQLAKTMMPLEFQIVGSIHIDGDKKDIADRDAYYQGDEINGVTTRNQIILATPGAKRAKQDETISHEFTHYEDQLFNIRGIVAALNMSGYSYVGQNKYQGTPTSIDGWHNVGQDYDNVDEYEDTAMKGQGLPVDKPIVRLENSPEGEKLQAVIFAMERQYPGFTAALLLRAKVDNSYDNQGIFNAAEYALAEKRQDIGLAANILVLAGALLEINAARRRRYVSSFRPAKQSMSN